MATDYFRLLTQAVHSLGESTPDARYVIYDRARKLVDDNLRGRTPPTSEAGIEAEQSALEDAIWRVEMNAGGQISAASRPTAPEVPIDTKAERSVSETRMRYVRSILQPGERILARGRYHWIVYLEAVLSLLIGLMFASLGSMSMGFKAPGDAWSLMIAIAAFVLILMAPILALKAWFNQWITEIAVTNRRVIRKSGFIRRRTWEMNMDKIESVTVDQSIPGRILGYGTLHVLGTGVGVEHLHRIASPIQLRNRIVAR
jgi:uncharacterized membrane protein YdbT with pleckstrin-like domain